MRHSMNSTSISRITTLFVNPLKNIPILTPTTSPRPLRDTIFSSSDASLPISTAKMVNSSKVSTFPRRTRFTGTLLRLRRRPIMPKLLNNCLNSSYSERRRSFSLPLSTPATSTSVPTWLWSMLGDSTCTSTSCPSSSNSSQSSALERMR